MAEQQWEYCQLWLKDAEEVTPGLRDKWAPGWSYSCYVCYCSSAGKALIHVLSQLKAKPPIGFNPFLKAMALLGTFGWEMISVQHGNASHATGVSQPLMGSHVVAYFKRPAVSGRAVDEPKLDM
jgi:hypothetical protein